MVSDGLPMARRERGVHHDILAGADFLSILMDSSLHEDFIRTSTPSTEATTFSVEDVFHYDPYGNTVRPSRSTPAFAQEPFSVSDSSDSGKDGVILAISVSSSIGKATKKLHQPIRSNDIEETTCVIPPTTEIFDQTLITSEDHPSVVAKASKSELSVEESDPITKDSVLGVDYSRSYPTKIEALPRQPHSPFHPTASFLNQNIKEAKQPYHQTVIYHDTPNETGQARSVSYSSVIQAAPHIDVDTDKPVQHERHERNYNGAQAIYANNFNNGIGGKQNETKIFDKSYVAPVTQSWEKPETVTTEKNWETQEKPYVPPSPPSHELPKVYGRPEQNYEVDEVVSVVTNGRVHGVQPSIPPKPEKKPDDNQKVGYVVEGRNYRKYRVEERTADGFIVGEYGVVSHDDGSLRGVRYTADGTINPRLISEALLKFLSL